MPNNGTSKQKTNSATATIDTITVMLLDDHEVVRQGTRHLLEQLPGLEVRYTLATLAEAKDWLEAVERNQQRAPDLCVLDINLPDGNCFSLIPQLFALPKKPKLLCFSAFAEPGYVHKAVQAGVQGFVAKTVEASLFHEAVSSVLKQDAESRETLILPDSLEVAYQEMLGSQERSGDLTPREHEILVYVAKGYTNRQMAEALVLSVKTVDTHVARLIKKLNVKNRAQLTAYAYNYGLV